MSNKRDEYLEALFCLKEQGRDSVEDLRTILDIPFEGEVIDRLVSDNLAVFDSQNRVAALTEEGLASARELVRKHRLAERLLHDVLRVQGKSFEGEACVFEHLMAPQLVEGICTLLGHPRDCPHGLPIPEGECCKRNEMMVPTSVAHLTNLAVSQTGHVAYINCQDDAQLHRLNGLQLKPGVEITLHQKYPSYVVECEGGMIALDELIANNICIWKIPADGHQGVDSHEERALGKSKKGRFWQRRRESSSGASSY